MVNPDDEDALRLGMFAASLLVIAHRQRVVAHSVEIQATVTTEISFGSAASTPTPDVSPVFPHITAEARAIVDVVIEEAKRLNAQRKTV